MSTSKSWAGVTATDRSSSQRRAGGGSISRSGRKPPLESSEIEKVKEGIRVSSLLSLSVVSLFC